MKLQRAGAAVPHLPWDLVLPPCGYSGIVWTFAISVVNGYLGIPTNTWQTWVTLRLPRLHRVSGHSKPTPSSSI